MAAHALFFPCEKPLASNLSSDSEKCKERSYKKISSLDWAKRTGSPNSRMRL